VTRPEPRINFDALALCDCRAIEPGALYLIPKIKRYRVCDESLTRMALNAETLRRLVALFAPQMRDPQQRGALINQALFGEDNLLNSIDYTGTPEIFVVNLIDRLHTYRQMRSGAFALIAVLEVVEKRYGADKAAEFQQLRAAVEANDPQEAVESENLALSSSTALGAALRAAVTDGSGRHIFLSYSRRDADLMRRVRDDLAGARLPVWTDEKIEPGTPAWFREVEGAIDKAFCIVVLLSPDAKGSEWVGKEIEYAQMLKKMILPVLARGEAAAAIPFSLAGAQFVDLSKDFALGVRKLVVVTQTLFDKDMHTAPGETTQIIRQPEYRLDPSAWRMLLDRIRKGKCTPFLGPGLSATVVKSEREIAKQWAEDHDYPLGEAEDLAQVAQFLSLVEYDTGYVKESMMEGWFDDVARTNFQNISTMHALLAKLPLPLYVSACYDDFMVAALKQQRKQPVRLLYDEETTLSNNDITPDRPLLYHLYGHYENPTAAILTEDDYLDYLVKVAKKDIVFPPPVERRITTTTLMFVGFEISHWNFRVLFRILAGYLERNTSITHIAVQVAPSSGDKAVSGAEDREKRVHEYLKRYFERLKIHVYVGETVDFIDELTSQWEKLDVSE